MARLKGCVGALLVVVATLCGSTVARLINITIYDTNPQHVTYGPNDDFCVRWVSSWIFWTTCEVWAQPWRSDVYRDQGRITTVHRSLDHQLPSVTIRFKGSAVWLYGPPRTQLMSAVPPDYKICLYENHMLASNPTCYRVDVAEAYAEADRYGSSPVVLFAKGGLQYQEHRVVISVADPIDETRFYRGIQFSHAVYSINRPTPWPVEEDSWRYREVVMHDTHPLLSYWPRPISPACSGWSCRLNTQSGWTPKTYRSRDGTVTSWHELVSRDSGSRGGLRVEATFTAGAVAVYGVPKAHLNSIGRLGPVCIQINSGPCEMVDTQHAYLDPEYHHESVPLWRHDALDPSGRTHISIRLDSSSGGDVAVLPFKAIHYFEPQEYASPDPPVGYIEDVAVSHDHDAIVYHPGGRCVRHFMWWCTKWFDPWVWREAGPSESKLTYRSTVSSYRTTEDPTITLEFQGSAVYVYGAPKSFIRDPFASQHICLNGICQIVDVEQAYLNAPEDHSIQSVDTMALDESTNVDKPDELDEHQTPNNITLLSTPALEPVLLWSMTGLDDKAPHTLRLALAELPSADNAEMSIAKVVYTKVTYEPGQSRPDTPIPQPDPGYEGPPYPYHARPWQPRGPPPALPHPTPPTPSPTPPPSDSDVLGTGNLLFWLVCSNCLLMLYIILSRIIPTRNSERESLLPSYPHGGNNKRYGS